ncbi:hypothetical protein QE152_g15774 [Popillia japonica]|uniref:Uncharacterized protein n=1 Tax=Popillia japonica TaxID=7064 RepID=A0AAW1L6P2_POPJA
MMLIDLAFLDTYNNVDLAVAAFYTKIFSIIDMHVAKRTTSSSKFSVWFSSLVIKLIKVKEYYFRKWKQVSSTIYEEFSELCKVVKIEAQREYKAYVHNTEEHIRRDSKQFRQESLRFPLK